MQYTTYYEEQESLSLTQYAEMKQMLLEKSGSKEGFEAYTIRKLRFNGNSGNDTVAQYYLCMKNQDKEEIYLEKKYIQNHIYHKACTKLMKEEAERIVRGDIEWMKEHKDSLLSDFYLQATLNHLYSSTVTEYEREMLKCSQGYVTFFKRISSAGAGRENFFGEFVPLINCLDEDKYLVTYKKKVTLPAVIRDMIQGSEPVSEELVYAF